MLVSAVLFLTTVLALWVTWWYMKFYKVDKYLSKIPGPRPLPIIGSAHRVNNLTKLIHIMMQFYKEFGGIYKIWIFHQIRLIIIDSKPVECLLTSNTVLKKSPDYEYFEPWFGRGLIHNWGLPWKKQRKLLNPTFHLQVLEQFIPIFNSQSDILVEKLRPKVGGVPLDICLPITLCTLDIICETTMGTHVNAQNEPDCEYVKSGDEMFHIAMERTISPIKMCDLLYVFTKDYWREKKILRYLHEYRDSVIARRKMELGYDRYNAKSNDCEVKQRYALLDFLLQYEADGQRIPDDVIRVEVDTFIAAGHDTTASAISFTLYCISRNSEVQSKAVEELRTIFCEDTDRSPSYRDLQEMKYLEMIIKESMRLYPPVPIIGRSVEENIEFNGDVLPKGVSILTYILGIHRQPEVYPDPEKFDPERFSSKNSQGRSPYVYLPFSAGPRNCIGQRFAMLEIKVVISKILRNFELLPIRDHTPVLQASIVLRSLNGLPIMLKKRRL